MFPPPISLHATGNMIPDQLTHLASPNRSQCSPGARFTPRSCSAVQSLIWKGECPPPQSEDNAMVRQTTTPKKDLGSGTNKPPKPDEGKDKDTERPDPPQRDERKGREDNC